MSQNALQVRRQLTFLQFYYILISRFCCRQQNIMGRKKTKPTSNQAKQIYSNPNSISVVVSRLSLSKVCSKGMPLYLLRYFSILKKCL